MSTVRPVEGWLRLRLAEATAKWSRTRARWLACDGEGRARLFLETISTKGEVMHLRRLLRRARRHRK